MARCIAFDKQTAQAISTHLHFLTFCDPGSNPVESALQSDSPHALLAMPAEASGHVLMARFQRRTGLPDALPPSSAPVAFAAGGFLGLSDEPVFDSEPPARKKWWQKILD